MIIIHVLDDSRFLCGRKRIRRHEFGGFDPINLAESADESDANEVEPEKLEIMRLRVLTGRGKVSEVALASIFRFFRSYLSRIRKTCEAASRLYIIGIAVALEDSQRYA